MTKFLIALSLHFILFTVSAQKVGLVLSGGGAKGLAHIGVIRALEENHIPIDYIAGTSMGAIIGGLYAIGYTPDEMEQLVTSEDFKRWSVGKIEPEYIYYFKKKDPEASMINIKLAMKDSSAIARLPSNIVPTHQMDFAFMKILAGPTAESHYNFDSLFVPFRCVASDVHDNELYVMRSGELASAIRASMTFPFYFKPIRIDGKLLFDGGMYNNFPWQVLQNDFHPDYLIGSKTADNSPEPDEDNIFNQLENMLLGKTDFNMPKGKSILIETPLKNISLLQFDDAKNIIEKGYESTIDLMDSIKNFIPVRRDSTELSQRRKNFKKNIKPLEFDKIYIRGVNNLQKNYIKNSLRRKGRSLSVDDFKKEYFKLLADDKISNIYPRAIYNDSTKFFDLYLDTKVEKKFEARIGGNISSSSINQGYAGIEYNHLGEIGTNLYSNVYFGRLYSSFLLKGRLDYPAKVPFYLDGGLTLNRWDYFNSSNDPFFEDVRPSYIILNEANMRLEAGMPLNTNDALKFGSTVLTEKDQYYQVKNFSKSDTADQSEFNAYTFYLQYEKNTLNNVQYPTSGQLNKISLRYVNGIEEFLPGSSYFSSFIKNKGYGYLDFSLTRKKFYVLNKYFNLGWQLDINLSTKKLNSNYLATMLQTPAFNPTPLSKTLFLRNYRANNFIALGIVPVFKINDNLNFQTMIYFFQPYRHIIATENYKAEYEPRLKYNCLLGSAGLVLNSPFGPASLSLNYYSKQDKKFYLQFNFGYILFNKRGIE